MIRPMARIPLGFTVPALHLLRVGSALPEVVKLQVDPEEPANRPIVDLKLAPRGPRGRVEFRADFFLLRPADLAYGRAEPCPA